MINCPENEDVQKSCEKDSDKGSQERNDFTESTTCLIPLARVRRIVKKDPEIKSIASDACFLIAKATEIFIEHLAVLSYAEMKKAGRKNNIQYKDLSLSVLCDTMKPTAKVVKEVEEMEFLNDIIPEQSDI
ncbi:uncharacterized protein LOC126325878 [Schistocerca gregaria]|uniref:uncharacterized protein LOC126325878 n=1 Tax=Schistocerca gregaria TaxID=7010 RepID=UPI00211EC01A|nr:uncharacterized protein LOC126325878 [Schistocerca gregaria]